MSRARDFANLAGSADAGGITGKNLIINGAFQCWQRTTSVTTSVTGTFSADRWASNAGASTVFSRSTDVPTGFQFSISVAGSAFTGIRTRIEAADCKKLAGQQVTFSWYAKRTAGTGDMRTFLGYASAEDNFGTVTLIEDVVNTASASVSSDWARYTYTVTLPASAANGLNFIIYNGSSSGSVTTLYTGIQLEVGEQATPFEHRSYGDELARCQRYFQIIPSNSAAYSFPLVRHRSATNSYSGSSYYPVTMRTNATITLDTSGSWIHKPNTRQDTGSATVVSSSSSVFTVVATPSTNDSTQYLAFSNNNVEADAEL